MSMKFVAAPSNLLAEFMQQDGRHTPKYVDCPVVALAETELGQLRAMCAVPQYEYFVAFDEVHKHLHRVHGGLFRFVGFHFVGTSRLRMRRSTDVPDQTPQSPDALAS